MQIALQIYSLVQANWVILEYVGTVWHGGARQKMTCSGSSDKWPTRHNMVKHRYENEREGNALQVQLKYSTTGHVIPLDTALGYKKQTTLRRG